MVKVILIIFEKNSVEFTKFVLVGLFVIFCLVFLYSQFPIQGVLVEENPTEGPFKEPFTWCRLKSSRIHTSLSSTVDLDGTLYQRWLDTSTTLPDHKIVGPNIILSQRLVRRLCTVSDTPSLRVILVYRPGRSRDTGRRVLKSPLDLTDTHEQRLEMRVISGAVTWTHT